MPKISLLFSKISGYDLIIIACTFAAIIATYIRLYFGVDFTDEAYYVARAYQYALGAKPWVDDISLLPFAILTVPFVKLYYWLVGNTDGIILFTRHLYFAFNCLVAGLVFLYTKFFLKWSTALLVASICIVFIPFNIPNLSYNTMGSGFFTAGCFWGAWVISTRRNTAYLFFSGLCHGLAIFSYPTLIIPSFIYIGLLLWVSSVRKIQALLAYFLGGLPIAFLLLNLILEAGISNVLISREYAHSLGYSASSEKIYSVLTSLWNSYTYKIPIFLVLFALYIGNKRIIKDGIFSKCIILLPLVPIPNIYSGYDLDCGCRFSIGYLFYYSTLAPYLLLFVHQDKDLQKLFYLLWFPSFIGGIVIAYTSGNGYVSAGLGMLSASISTTILLIKAFLKLAGKNNLKTSVFSGEMFAPLLVVLVLVFSQYYLVSVSHIIYRDADISNLNRKIERGPFGGLYTSQEKKDYIVDISNDLNAVYRPGDRVLFYYNNFPAGYLLTSMRSATKVSFLVEPNRYKTEKVRQVIASYIRHKIDNHSVIAVKMEKVLLWDYFSYKSNGDNSDFISQTIEDYQGKKYSLSKKNYSIYRIESK